MSHSYINIVHLFIHYVKVIKTKTALITPKENTKKGNGWGKTIPMTDFFKTNHKEYDI